LAQQHLEGQQQFRGVCPRMPPWLQVWLRLSGYLAKPTLFDETK